MALAGSLVGSVAGIFVGLPIPVVGSVVAAVLFAGIGAMTGAIAGELSLGRTADAGWRVGKAAFWGRMAGTLGKMLVGTMIIAVVAAAHRQLFLIALSPAAAPIIQRTTPKATIISPINLTTNPASTKMYPSSGCFSRERERAEADHADRRPTPIRIGTNQPPEATIEQTTATAVTRITSDQRLY